MGLLYCWTLGLFCLNTRNHFLWYQRTKTEIEKVRKRAYIPRKFFPLAQILWKALQSTIFHIENNFFDIYSCYFYTLFHTNHVFTVLLFPLLFSFWLKLLYCNRRDRVWMSQCSLSNQPLLFATTHAVHATRPARRLSIGRVNLR